MRNIVINYTAVGMGVAIVTVAVLVKDGKDSPAKIATYASLNGVLWPAAIVAGIMKGHKLKLEVD